MEQHTKLLNLLNEQMLTVHRTYEKLFWKFSMGDHSVDDQMQKAQADVDIFRSNEDLYMQVTEALNTASKEEQESLLRWKRFFDCYRTPKAAAPFRQQALELESKVEKNRASRKQGFIDPISGDFVEASRGKLRMMMTTEPDEKVRKACFEAVDALAVDHVVELIELVRLRNEYARALGYDDFYAYKLHVSEGMTKEDVFPLFEEIYEKTKFGFEKLKAREAVNPGLRKPWNMAYMLSGDAKKKRDPYIQFEDVVLRWGTSFAALGIGFQGATLQLDLVDRKGKYDNGFCHWPELVHFNDGERIPGASNFTSNVVPGQVGSGDRAAVTLFHEGGHAAQFTNVETPEACMNHEYPPTSIAWAETHSMFLDTMQSSPEWWSRYAKDAEGNSFPFSIYEEEAREAQPQKPLRLMNIIMVIQFERWLYEAEDLTEELVLAKAREITAKHNGYTDDSHLVLGIPHIYSWESSCYYQGYGLAQLAVAQWSEYFYEKYEYIVDNPNVGPDMYAVWKYSSVYTFKEFVRMSTGKQLSADAYLAQATCSLEEQLQTAKERIGRLRDVPEFSSKIDLDAVIKMVHGDDIIADNSLGFEAMSESYKQWFRTLLQDKAA